MGHVLVILDLAGAVAFGGVVGWTAGTMLRKERRTGLGNLASVAGALGGAATTLLSTGDGFAFGLYLAGFALGFLAGFRSHSARAPDWLGSRPTASSVGPADTSLNNILVSTVESVNRSSALGRILGRLAGLINLPRRPADFREEPDLREEREETTLVEPPSARVLNANFADATGRIVPPTEMLRHGTPYDLLVDIGPAWGAGLSIVSGSSEFPDDQLPKHAEGHQIQVVFISEEFVIGEGDMPTTVPQIATAMLWLPSHGGQSHPLLPDGRPRDNPGPVALRLRTPPIFATEDERSPWSVLHGRICLYFENNLLQSAAVQISVGHPQEAKTIVKNEIKVDFVLTNFHEVAPLRTRQIEPLSPEAGEDGEPIVLNLTLNDDGSGMHRIVISTKGEQAAIHYDPIGSEQLLSDARGVIGDCYWQRNDDGSFVVDNEWGGTQKRRLALAPDNGKSLKAFKWDLFKLADYGNKLFGLIFNNVTPPKGKTQLQWIRQLRSTLADTATIQVARTGPAQYVFPWGLVYDYELVSEKDYKICKVVDEEWGLNSRRKDGPIPTRCPHHEEAYHQQNVICPYGFWGLRHRIEQPPSLSPEENSQAEAVRVIGSDQRFDFHAAFTSDSSLNQNLIQQHIDKLKAIPGLQFAPPPATDWTNVRQMLRAPQVAYFLCHGEFDADRKESYLGVGPRDDDLEHRVYVSKLNSFMISQELNADEWARRAPLIVINGCHTTDLAPGQLLNFVSSFASAGASGVIGTEVSVILPVAVEVGELLFQALTQKQAVADAIRSIRWRLANRGNLLGLAYTPYCLADLRIRSNA